MTDEADVVVVGAGLAGLRCAGELTRRGHDVVLLERADAVGGRIRTDRVEGFLLDRGFQLLNPAYPAVKRQIDVAALDLQPFDAGVAARTAHGLTVLGHPWAAPRLLPASARTLVRRPREVVATARWLAPLLRARPGRRLAATLVSRPDQTRGEALDRAGLDGLLRVIVDRFFAGVVLEDDGSTSQSYALLLATMFAAGTPALPRHGMQALPEQLAAPLGVRVRLGVPVASVEPRDDTVLVHVDGGDALRARQVVVAVGAPEVADLVDTGLVGHGLGVPSTKGVLTHWFATDEPPTPSRLLHVDGRERPGGPLVNAAVVSNPAPSYAPAGQHLVEASALLGPGRPVPTEDEVRRHAAELLGSGAPGRVGAAPGHWRLLRRDEVPHALPAQSAPLSLRRPVRVSERVVVCGDHRDTASIQGALVSGQRAAVAAGAAL